MRVGMAQSQGAVLTRSGRQRLKRGPILDQKVSCSRAAPGMSVAARRGAAVCLLAGGRRFELCERRRNPQSIST
jgi:hypothetical protein